MSLPPAGAPRRRFEERDADPRLMAGCRVAVLGYGNQGHAQAQNLRDSGVRVVVGARAASTAGARARADGFEVTDLVEAAAAADLAMLLLPDEAHREVFAAIAPRLRAGAVVGFAHGFSVAFGQVQLPPQQRALLVAPKGQGHRLRDAFRHGSGVPGLIAVEGPQPDATLALALAYARACGALAGGGWLTTFREEAITDQFGEQAVLVGGLTELITAAWETLVQRGYDPEIACFECLYEVKLIVDLIDAHGIDGMRERISSTAAFGGLRAGPRVVGQPARAAMAQLLEEIERGSFARAFLREQEAGAPWRTDATRREREHPLQQVGRALRERLARLRPDATPGAARPDGGAPEAGRGGPEKGK